MAKKNKRSQNQVQQEAHDALAKNDLPPVINSGKFRCLGDWPEETSRQTWPPTVPTHHTYLPGEAPIVQVWDYSNHKSTAESREIEQTKQFQAQMQEIRRAAEAHRTVRRHIQSYIQPGMKLYDIAEELERVSEIVTEAKGTKTGKGFPTGLSLNHTAAHYTPNPDEKECSPVFTENDVMKVDFGTQVNGRIIDCAFTLAMDEKYDPLLMATKEATETGLKMAGPDAIFGELATAMGEVISSYEVELNGKTVPVIPIRNLNGHTMEQFSIHAGKSLPFHKCSDPTRMEENEIYAIETFATAGGLGYVEEKGDCSHYMMPKEHAGYDANGPIIQKLPTKSSRDMYKCIQQNFSSLAFCKRWLANCPDVPSMTGLEQLAKMGLVHEYPPLVDANGSYTSQFEHTVWLRPSGKEVLSRGPDF